MQLDEKWAFVHKKQARCDPEDQHDHTAGDCWDHVAFDPEHRLVLGVVFGKRSASRIKRLLADVKGQLQGRTPALVTSDQLACYQTVIRQVWRSLVVPPERDRRCTRQTRHRRPRYVPEPAMNYAMVCKARQNGRVVSVQTKTVFGSDASVAAALRASDVSNTVNTSFVERNNATDRHRNARKARRTASARTGWFTRRWATSRTTRTTSAGRCARWRSWRSRRSRRSWPRTRNRPPRKPREPPELQPWPRV